MSVSDSSFCARSRALKLSGSWPSVSSFRSREPSSSLPCDAGASPPPFAPSSPSGGTDADPARRAGVANACAPPVAYAENAFTFTFADRLECCNGDLLLWCPNPGTAAGDGDFGRFAAVANGEADDANASKPRLVPVSERDDVLENVLDIVLLKSADGATMEPLAGLGLGLEEALGKVDVLVLAHGEL